MHLQIYESVCLLLKNLFSYPCSSSSIDSTEIFIQDLSKRAIVTAEAMLTKYQEKISLEKQKILKNQAKFKKQPTVDQVMIAIENREMNMIERSQYKTKQLLKCLQPTTTMN